MYLLKTGMKLKRIFNIYLLLIFGGILIIFYYMYLLFPTELDCYDSLEDSLQDFMKADVDKDKSIFFLDTSCNSHKIGRITITSRVACAVESAARLNPNMNVFLLFTSPGPFELQTKSDMIVDSLFTYENLALYRLYVNKFVEGSVVERLFKYRKVHRSTYARWHSSDILRLLLLSKYGGVYMDTDVLSLQSIESLGLNYVGLQAYDIVNGAVMSFSHRGSGKTFVDDALRLIADNYREGKFTAHGPDILTNLMMRECKVKTPSKLSTMTICNGIKIHGWKKFHPIRYYHSDYLFNENATQHILHYIRDSYTIHLWNFLNSPVSINISGNTTLAVLAKKYCPSVAAVVDFM